MALYGSIPFMMAHGAGGSSGMLWLNPTESFIDVSPPADDATSGGGE